MKSIESIVRRVFDFTVILRALLIAAVCLSATGRVLADTAEIRAAWKARQHQIKTARFEWRDEHTDMAGSRPSMADSTKRFPEKDVTNTLSNVLTVAGPSRFRHSRTGAMWDMARESYIDREFTAAFDGELGKIFFGKGVYGATGESVFPTGSVRKEQSYAAHVNTYTLPTLLFVWPLAEGVGTLSPTAKIEREQVAIDGVRCTVVNSPGGPGDSDRKYFLDPARGFLVVRLVTSVGGRVGTETDISYSEDERFGWVPAAWETKSKLGDETSEINRGKVRSWQINVGVTEDDASFDFPEFTKVTDRSGGAAAVYISKPNGGKRIVTREENSYIASYEELIRTESGKAIPEEFLVLAARMNQVGTLDAAAQEQLIKDINAYFASMPASPRNLQFAQQVAASLVTAGNEKFAVAACEAFATAMGGQRELTELAVQIAGEARRARLVGKEMELDGVLVDGKPIDWKAYRGKVVLVDFWYMGCKPCVAAFPAIKAAHEKYKDRGFKVVGISTDQDPAALKEFLKLHALPWTTVYAPDGEQPTVKRYGIDAFPTYFFVGRDGKVAGVEIETKEFEPLIEVLLGAERK